MTDLTDLDVDLESVNERMDQINRIMVGANRAEAFIILAELTAIAVYGYGMDKGEAGDRFAVELAKRIQSRAAAIRAAHGGDGFPPDDVVTETIQ